MNLNFALLLFYPIMFVCCDSAKILAVFPQPGKSHYVMFRNFLKELARRGHTVDVVNHFPLEESILGYNDISIRGSTPIFTNSFPANLLMDLSLNEILKIMTVMAGTNQCEAAFKTKQLKELRNSTKKYDLVITEVFGTDCMLGWAWHFGAPSVVMTSSVNLPWGPARFGQPDNPSYIPNYFVEYGAKMTLWERVYNTFCKVYTLLAYYWFSTRTSNRMAKEFFGENMPDLNVLAYNTSLHLINSHFSLGSARPLVPNVVEVAGLHIEKQKPLSEHFNKVLNTDSKGVILLTFGSLVLTETFPNNILQPMFDAFGELPYKVLWKANAPKFSKDLRIPANIHFESWLPQRDILCDSRVKLFVSHGGMMGTQEAVECGVPILGIPIFADQRLNIRQAQNRGFAIMLELMTLTKEEILDATKKLLYNPSYSENAKRISRIFKDRPMSAMDTAVYWVEYVIRHKGAPQIQSVAKELAWWQYYLVDVMAILVGLPCLCIFLLFVLIRKLFLKDNTKIKVKKS